MFLSNFACQCDIRHSLVLNCKLHNFAGLHQSLDQHLRRIDWQTCHQPHRDLQAANLGSGHIQINPSGRPIHPLPYTDSQESKPLPRVAGLLKGTPPNHYAAAEHLQGAVVVMVVRGHHSCGHPGLLYQMSVHLSQITY